MRAVQAIAKTERNAQQGFNFRGIDSTINAVAPALREHGVIFIPEAQEIITEQYETKSKTQMRNVVVKVAWTIIGPEGDSITAATFGEAADSGDKAVSKAHSVAYRTVLLQTLCIPTDDLDPDAASHERSQVAPPRTPPPAPSRAQAWSRLWDLSKKIEPDLDQEQRRVYLIGELQAQKLDGSRTGDLQAMTAVLEKVVAEKVSS